MQGFVRTIGSINWLVTAFVFGLGTFVFASIYGDLLGYFSDMPPVKASAGFLKAGYSWPAILALTALFPAVFEELAFRGIIVPDALGAELPKAANGELTISPAGKWAAPDR